MAPVAPVAPAAAAASTAQAPALAAASPAGPLDSAAAAGPATGHTAASKVATGRDEAAAAAVRKGSSIESQTAPAAAGWLDSSAFLHTSACAALGLGPSEQGPLFTDVRAKIAYSHALSVNHLAVQLQVDRCNMVAPPAQAVPAPGQQQDATAEAAAVTAATTDAAGDSVSPAPPEVSQAATGDAAAAAAAPAGSAAVRRSARLAAAATPVGGQSAPVSLTPLHHLYAAVLAGAPVAAFDDGDEDDSGQYLAVWVCGQGDSPAAFTGDEAQVRLGACRSCGWSFFFWYNVYSCCREFGRAWHVVEALVMGGGACGGACVKAQQQAVWCVCPGQAVCARMVSCTAARPVARRPVG